MSLHEISPHTPEGGIPAELSETRYHLHMRVDELLTDRRTRLSRRPDVGGNPEQLDRDHEYLGPTIKSVLDERIARSRELKSPEISEARTLAHSILPGKLAIIDCIDGRMPPSVIFGFTLGMAKGYRSPAGNLLGYDYDDTTGKLELAEDAMLHNLLKGFSNGDNRSDKYEALGSHLGCAAQLREEQASGRDPLDNGLWRNVMIKKEKAKDIDAKFDVAPLQYSFDPRTGYTYWGLEKNSSIERGRQNGEMYTADLLEELSAPAVELDGSTSSPSQVLSTRYIAEQFNDVFAEYEFDISWAGKYKESAQEFWRAMKAMEEPVLPQIDEMVKKLYADSEYTLSPNDIRMRSVLMLSNAFNAWLHTRGDKKFPFDMHDEELMVIDQKSKGPFKKHPALVSAPEPSTIGRDIVLTQGIIRGNRRIDAHNAEEERYVKDRTGTFEPGSPEWIKAPVITVYKSEVDILDRDKDTWDKIRGIDWNNDVRLDDGRIMSMKYAWKHVDENVFKTWLGGQLGRDVNREDFMKIYKVVNTTRTTLRTALLDFDCGQLVKRGAVTIVPLLVSSDRQPQSIVHFAA